MNKRPRLSAQTIYLAPSGRRCTWSPCDSSGTGRKGWFTFLYVGGRSGFTLSRENLHILQPEVKP